MTLKGRMVTTLKGRIASFMLLRLLIAFSLLLPAASCGLKSELYLPDGKPTPRDQKDPSQPPSPISR
jgi:predicted small lipoprotein YifL